MTKWRWRRDMLRRIWYGTLDPKHGIYWFGIYWPVHLGIRLRLTRKVFEQ